MNIEVRLFATLRPYMDGACKGQLEMLEGATIADVVARLALPDDEVRLIFVNGKHEKRETVLHEGDRVGLFPPVGGG